MRPHSDNQLLATLRQDRALGFLDAEGHARLRDLERDASGAPDDYELAAAAVLLTARLPRQPLPTGLREQLRRTLSTFPDSTAP